MVGFFDLFQPLGDAAGFPFGAPQIGDAGSSFVNDVQTGDIGGAQSWGKPPIPGTAPAAPGRLAAVAPGGIDIAAPTGNGLVRAGTDDLRGAAPGAQGAPVPPLPPSRPAAEPQGPPIPPGLLEGGRREGPPLATPQQAAAGRITPGTPLAVSGPVGAPGGTVGTDPALRSPYAQPGTAVPGAAAGATPLAAGPAANPAGGSGGLLDKLKGLSGNKDFMGALGKLSGAMGGGGGGGGADMGSSGSMGDPTGASRANASKLFESIMQGKGPKPVAGVPELPPGILQLFQG
jgi:hypothetical protein